MSIFARTFKRETIMMKTDFDGEGSSWSTPSIRSRNLQPSSNGSRWMSLARLRSACSRIWLTMRTIRPLASAGGAASRLRMFSSSWCSSPSSRRILGALADALGVLVGVVKGVEPGLNDRQRRDDRVDPQAGQELELIHDAHLLGGDERDVEYIVPDRHGADQPIHAELLGEQCGDFLVDLAGFQVVGDRRQKQVLGVDVGDLLLGDVARLGSGPPRARCWLWPCAVASSISSSCLGLNQLRRDSSSRIRGWVSVSAKTVLIGDRRSGLELEWEGLPAGDEAGLRMRRRRYGLRIVVTSPGGCRPAPEGTR